jgi:hypothetical protein
VIGECIFGHNCRRTLTYKLDAVHGFDLHDRLGDDLLIDSNVVAGIETELIETQEYLVEPDDSLTAQAVKLHGVERRAIGDKHRSLTVVAVVKSVKACRHSLAD